MNWAPIVTTGNKISGTQISVEKDDVITIIKAFSSSDLDVITEDYFFKDGYVNWKFKNKMVINRLIWERKKWIRSRNI